MVLSYGSYSKLTQSPPVKLPPIKSLLLWKLWAVQALACEMTPMKPKVCGQSFHSRETFCKEDSKLGISMNPCFKNMIAQPKLNRYLVKTDRVTWKDLPWTDKKEYVAEMWSWKKKTIPISILRVFQAIMEIKSPSQNGEISHLKFPFHTQHAS